MRQIGYGLFTMRFSICDSVAAEVGGQMGTLALALSDEQDFYEFLGDNVPLFPPPLFLLKNDTLTWRWIYPTDLGDHAP